MHVNSEKFELVQVTLAMPAHWPLETVQVAPGSVPQTPAAHRKLALPVVGKTSSIAVDVPPGGVDCVYPRHLFALSALNHATYSAPQFAAAHVAPGFTAPQVPAALQVKFAEPELAPVEATAEVEPAAVVAMVPVQVWPPTVHDFVPAAQGAAVQEDDPVFTHAPLVQVKVALPELPLLDDTVLATPSSAADTLAPHVTPGAPDHVTCPPLHGIAADVPPL